MNKSFAISKGNILLAEPFMMGPHFKNAVVLITEHNEEHGTVGFIINKSLNLSMEQAVDEFPEISMDLLYGGPVQTDTLHYIHTYGDILDDSVHISGNLYWGGNFTKLKALINQKLINSNGIRFFLGYSGWSPGQLREEYEEGTWILSNIDANYIFNTDLSRVWPRAVADLGKEFTVIARMPGTIHWN
jgi:putative transcriptional regulator